MKRFACHHLVLSADTILKQYIVETDGYTIKRFYPFTEEIESTVWLGGTIVLSTIESYSFDENKNLSFQELIVTLTQDVEKAIAENRNIYAYHFC